MKKVLSLHLATKMVPPLMTRKTYLVLSTIDTSDGDKYSEQIYEVY